MIEGLSKYTVYARPSRWEWLDRSMIGLLVGSWLITVVAAIVQVRFGAFTMTNATVFGALTDPTVWRQPGTIGRYVFGDQVASWLWAEPAFQSSNETLVVWELRIPRVLAAVAVGLNLAISGAIFQAITRNELASPFILGVSSGAGLAILLSLVVFGSLAVYIPIFAAIGGTVAFLIVYAIAWNGGTSPVRLVLAGVIVSTVFGSIQTGLLLFADDLGIVQTAITWLTGSLSGTGWEHVRLLLPWTLASLGLALVATRQLNVLVLGESTATSLGMNVERTRFLLATIAIFAATATVAVAGIIGFVGLIVPHIVRTIVGSDYTRVIIGCTAVGPALLVAADVFARLALAPVQIPVGIVTGVIGGTYFLYLMRRRQKLGEL